LGSLFKAFVAEAALALGHEVGVFLGQLLEEGMDLEFAFVVLVAVLVDELE
jgi:hypothetical protein